jgi:hypothetical protein
VTLVSESYDDIITSAPGDHDKLYQFDSPEQMLARFDRFEWNRLWSLRARLERLRTERGLDRKELFGA